MSQMSVLKCFVPSSEIVPLDNTVLHSAVWIQTCLRLLGRWLTLPHAVSKGMLCFFKPCNSALLCSSVALPLARWDREMPVLGFMQTLLCSESSRTNVTVCVLSTLSNTATCFSSFNSSTFLFRSPLLYFPHLYPHLLVFLSLSLISFIHLSFLHPILLFQPLRKSMLAAAESALKQLCQPRPASALSPFPCLIPTSLAPSLARHIKWPLMAASVARSNSDVTPLYMSHKSRPKKPHNITGGCLEKTG